MHFRPFLILALVCLPWAALLCYQRFWIRDKIPGQYQARLTSLLDQYSKNPSAAERIQTAEEIEVCFNRLSTVGIRLRSGLEELQFYTKHLSWLQEYNAETAVLPDSRVSDQIIKYENVVSDLLSNLVRSNDSLAKRTAYLALAKRYLEEKSTQNATEIISSLDSMIQQDQQADDSIRTALAEMLLEQAWRSEYENLVLIPDRSTLERSRIVAEPLTSGSPNRDQLLARIDTFLDPKAVISSNAMVLETAESRIVNAIVQGNWDDVLWELTNSGEHQKEVLSKWAGIQISRTLLSDFSALDSAWCARATNGLQLAARLSFDSPELQSLMWQLAMRHAEVGGARASTALLDAVLSSDRGEFKFPILVYSNLLKGMPDNAKKYLDLALQINPQIADLVAVQCIWYVQRDKQYLSQWSDLIYYLRAKSASSGGAHLAACLVAIEVQDWEVAQSALREAKEILGEVSAVSVLAKRLEQAPGK